MKPTSVTADAYIQYQATKHTNRQTDLLEDILECIRNNPVACNNGPMHNNSNNIKKLLAEQQPKNIPQGRGQDLRQKTVNNPREDTDHTQQDNVVVKMQYGRTVKRPYK